MSNQLAEKVILITGSSRGIGAEMARYFARKGYRIVLNYARSKDEAHQVYDEIYAYNQNIILVQADVTDRRQVKAMFDQAVGCFGRVDILINNASINMDSSIMAMTDEHWQKVIDVNLTGTFICSQEFVFHCPGGDGQIVNIASNSSLTGRKNGANYCSAKAGVVTLTKCLAQELAPRIKVNCIILGYVNTEEVMERYHLSDPINYQELVKTIPLARLGDPQDICRAVNFMVSESSYMTGQNLFVNGGNYMG